MDLARQIDQHIRIFPHGTDDHNDLVALLLRGNSPAGCRENLFAVGNAGTAKFLYDDRHDKNRLSGLVAQEKLHESVPFVKSEF